jgi:hypothetical protein
MRRAPDVSREQIANCDTVKPFNQHIREIAEDIGID